MQESVKEVDDVEVVLCPLSVIKRKGEEYNNFSERRVESNKLIRSYCHGSLFWNTAEKGTYDVGSNITKAERKEAHCQKVKKFKAERRKNGK